MWTKSNAKRVWLRNKNRKGAESQRNLLFSGDDLSLMKSNRRSWDYAKVVVRQMAGDIGAGGRYRRGGLALRHVQSDRTENKNKSRPAPESVFFWI